MKKTTTFVFAAALSCASLLAQTPEIIKYSGGFQFEAPAQEEPATVTKIFSNLGPAKSAFIENGFLLAGPLSVFIAMPFTPKADSHISQVRAAVQYDGNGANQVDLSLYSDASGVPGALLAGPVTVKNLPNWYTCCKLAIANFTSAVAVAAGTQYWVVADTPATGTGSDFYGVWAFVPPPVTTSYGVEQNGSWYSSPASFTDQAGAVYGTTP